MKSYRIRSDEYQAVIKMTRYLTELGHTKIGLVGGVSGITSFDIKKKAFLDAADEMGFAYQESWIVEGDYSIDGGIQGIRKLIENKERPSAIIAINDLVAIGAIKVCDQMGIGVPRDLSIIGFDNIELSKVIHPPLTTVAHPYEELGRRAIQTVHELVNGIVPLEDVLLDTELVIRDSCRKT